MSFLARLKSGLAKTSGKLSSGIGDIFTKRKLDAEMLEELEELLISADMGVSVAAELAATLKAQKFERDVTDVEVREVLSQSISEILVPYAKPLQLNADKKPHVVLVVGVNGNGKTTTIGKLAARYAGEGKKVVIAAGDTFRAAAVEQLAVWAERAGVECVRGEPNADPASVAYRALEVAKERHADVLFIDTAGRLHNQQNLMAELQKTAKVLQKLDETAPHDVIQVLDATTGQNALTQVATFKQLVGITGLVVTKLDGTAKGGVVIALVRQHQLPVIAVGVGEGVEDLREFDAQEFARSLTGLSSG